MNRSRYPLVALIALAAFGACGGDGGTTPEPELGGLEPLIVADSVNALVDPLPGIRTLTLNFRAAFEDLQNVGVAFTREDGARPGNPAAVTFPPAYLGRTFRYESLAGSWVVDEIRTGAPADGVRVLWYELDGSGEVLLPVQELGHIDLTDGDDAALQELSIHGVQVRVGGQDLDLVDFVQGYAASGGGTVHEAAGTYADADRTVQFEIAAEQGVSGGPQDYVVTSVLESGPVRYELRAEGAGSRPGGGLQDALRATFDLGSDRTIVEIQISGVGPEREASGTITFNGTFLANIQADNVLYSFTNADGDPLSATSTSELNAMVRAMLFAGLEPFTWLPLEMP